MGKKNFEKAWQQSVLRSLCREKNLDLLLGRNSGKVKASYVCFGRPEEFGANPLRSIAR